jgi:hypothetical protein
MFPSPLLKIFALNPKIAQTSRGSAYFLLEMPSAKTVASMVKNGTIRILGSLNPIQKSESQTMNGKSLAIFLCVLAILGSDLQSAAYAASSRACDAYARNYARNASRQGQVVRRGLLGGLLGAGVGHAAGSAGTGAAVGTGVGILSGDRKRQRKADKIYWAAYRDCMAGRTR